MKPIQKVFPSAPEIYRVEELERKAARVGERVRHSARSYPSDYETEIAEDLTGRIKRMLDDVAKYVEANRDLAKRVAEHKLHRIVTEISGDFSRTVASTVTARWRSRTTGRKVSPVDFVKLQYAQFLDDDRFSRTVLRSVDPDLCSALDVWLSRHPDEAFRLTRRQRTQWKPLESNDADQREEMTFEELELLRQLNAKRARIRRRQI